MKRTITLFIKLLLLVFPVCGSLSSFAQTPQVHVSPKPTWILPCSSYDKKPSERTVRDGYFYDLYEQQIQVEKKAVYTHYIREIISNTGIQNGSEISVSFDPAYERLDFHEVIVWRDNKPQNRLEPPAFKILADEEDFSKFIYQGTYSANLILNDIRKGDKIEYSYTITGRNPIFGDKFCRDIYLQGSKLIAHRYEALIASGNRKLNIKMFNKAVKPLITRKNNLVQYVWENFMTQPVVESDNDPSWFNRYDYAEVSDYQNWGEVVNWALDINQPPVNVTGELGDLINQLKSDCGNDKVKYFRKAVRTVQDEVRYMGIEIGEYSHRANRPEKVYKQRYGDCKDKSLLLVSMLRADGIDADMVLVNSDLNDKVNQCIPTPNAFDHAVVVAHIDGKQVWADATISNQGGDGTDIYFPDYGEGLILKPGNNSLSKIPPSLTGKIECVEQYTGSNDDKSKVALDVTTIYTLDQADRERDELASAGLAETEKDYLDYYSKTYSKIEKRDSLQVNDDLHKNILTTTEHYLISDFYKRDSLSGRAGADFYADFISHELPSLTNQTKTPVAVDYPYTLDYTIKMILPGGWDISDEHNSINRNAYKFSSNYSTDGDTLLLHYRFSYLKDFVAPDKLDEFRKDISDLKDNGGLSYSVDYPMMNPPFVLNFWLASLAFILAGFSVYTGFRIYRTETPGIVFMQGSSFIPIGGWLVLILIGLFLTPIGIAAKLYTGHYFSISKWDIYMHGKISSTYRLLLAYEVAGYVAIASYSVFCAILLLKKRDILPKYITGYYASVTGFFFLDYLFASGIGLGNDTREYNLLRAILVAGICIAYFKRSTRVEHTFIVPYPENNYSYEELKP